MLRFMNNSQAIFELTITQFGLVLASIILFTVTVAFIYNNDVQRYYELDMIAQDFSNHLQHIDTVFFEQKIHYQLPDTGYSYTVHLSADYMMISTNGLFHNTIALVKQLMIPIFPQNRTLTPEWVGSEELHLHYLNNSYEKTAKQDDPLTSINASDFSHYLHSLRYVMASKPVLLVSWDLVVIEKSLVYCDGNDDGIWKQEHDYITEMILVYQQET